MKKISPVNNINVCLDFGCKQYFVGRLASVNHKIYFEYDSEFLKKGLEISPFQLPLKSGVFTATDRLFEGLYGVFNDSLPDGWGRLLFDRFLKSQNILPSEITPLDRLTFSGNSAIGALTYEPDHSFSEMIDIDLDKLAETTQQILEGQSTDILSELLTLNGSSAGARPKAMIAVSKDYNRIIHGTNDLQEDYTYWIVKFANSQDGHDAGAIEYVYSLMAKEAGIDMPETYLFPATSCRGYFAIKRFDRDCKNRFHIHTACGLLHTDFRIPSLDYQDLIALTLKLTKDIREVEKIYRLAVFNVCAHNRDDHAKNFSFLMNISGEWKIAPAYDLTFSSGPSGEQSTMILGEGKNITMNHLQKLGEKSGISDKKIKEIINSVKEALNKWSILSKQYDVSPENIAFIEKRLMK